MKIHFFDGEMTCPLPKLAIVYFRMTLKMWKMTIVITVDYGRFK